MAINMLGVAPSRSTDLATKSYTDSVGGGGGGAPGFTQMIGTVTGNTPITITHGLNTYNVNVVVRRSWLQSGGLTPTTAGELIGVKWRITGLNTITLEPSDSWVANEFIVSVSPLNVAGDVTAPSAPTLSSPSQSSTSINLSVTGGTDAGVGLAGVNWYRSGVLVGTTGTDTFTDTNLTPNTAYSYTAKRFDYIGTESAASNTITPSTPALAAAPVFVSSALSAIVASQVNTLPITWSQVLAAGANNGIIVAVVNGNNGVNNSFTPTGTPTCTVGGQSLTFLGYQIMGSAVNEGFVAVWAGQGVPSGGASQSIVTSIASAGNTQGNAYGTSFFYTGVGSFGTLQSARAQGAPSIAVPSATNDLVWGLVGEWWNDTISAFSLTSRQNQTGVPAFIGGDTAGASSVTVSATVGNSRESTVVGLDIRHI